jgi:hypothetical protein
MGGEFEKYINNVIDDMFPDMEDILGKRILLKVDSRPGRNCAAMLVKVKFKGLYIHPGLPNATAIHQEMAQSYGPFKSAVRTTSTRLHRPATRLVK